MLFLKLPAYFIDSDWRDEGTEKNKGWKISWWNGFYGDSPCKAEYNQQENK